jgi:uncharacterized Fe-S cluster protein YjdI
MSAESDVMREYPGEGITVHWNAARCIHSGNCVRGLPLAFDPKRRPWIEASSASASEIAEVVLRCPSGALHFVRTDGGAQEVPDVPTTLTPVRNGPLYARGDIELRALDGTLIRRDTRATLCRCGLTQATPACDNACKAAGWHEPEPSSP